MKLLTTEGWIVLVGIALICFIEALILGSIGPTW